MAEPVFEEDIEAAVETAVRILGPQGRFDDKCQMGLGNVVVVGSRLGKLWYGDIESTDKVVDLAKEVNDLLTIESR
jgi:hypothetical protein